MAQIRFLRELFTGMWKKRQVPTTWKMAKTVLLYKKGDTGTLQNWRPISLTNCIYRIFTAIIAEIIQEGNRTEEIFSSTQKGFIARCNGCTEHSIMINEIFNDARRMNKDVIAMTIDCTNAFVSVPLELITSTLQQRGITRIINRNNQRHIHRGVDKDLYDERDYEEEPLEKRSEARMSAKPTTL